MTYEELKVEHERLVALKAWKAVQRIEDEMRQLRPKKVELAQDSYYYGTAADFSE